MDPINLTDIGIIVALTLGITQVIKMTKTISKRFIPLVACVVGALICGVGFGFTGNSLLAGVMFALIAMGLWSGTKTTIIE